jgi:hypothetical protein
MVTKAVDEELKKLANETAEMIKSIYMGKPAPGISHPGLHPFTIALKGHSDLFRDSGRLADAVRVYKAGPCSYVVGIRRGLKAESAISLTKLALILEHGIVLEVTEAMRGWLQAHGFRIAKTTTVLIIPARPVWGPIGKLMAKRALAEIPRNLSSLLKSV